MDFHNVNIKSIKQEAAESVELTFDIKDDLKEKFGFVPGQYLTIALKINGELHRRAYSICSDIYSSDLSILVKKLEGGLVSTFINDKLIAGDKVLLSKPNGEFKIDMNAIKDDEHLIFIGAGSGITPLMSMLTSVLKSHKKTTCHLIYGSRDLDSIIYHSKLDRLKLVYKEWLVVHHFLSSHLSNDFKGIAFKNVYHNERININFVGSLISNLDNEKIHGVYLCGPSALVDSTKEKLIGLNIPTRKIHREYFTAPVSEVKEIDIDFDSLKKRNVNVKLNGELISTVVEGDQNILRQLIEDGYDPPYSCLQGTCSSCKAKLTSGEVEMRVDIGLEDDEKEDGFILTCQSIPITEEVSCEYINTDE